jgi:DNA-binding MarR family transcriptional regulator
MKQKPTYDAAEERSLGFALSELVRLIRRDFLGKAREYKLTPELWRLLYCLDRDEGCRQTDLATVLDLTPVTLGRMVDRLEHRGLVRRAADPDDRRATRLYLTRKAASPIARMRELVVDTRRRAMRGLPPSDQAEFWHLLGRIRDNLAAGDPPRRGRR